MRNLSDLRFDSAIAYVYGPSVRDFVDQHGYIIRTAGSSANILHNVNNCKCSDTFSQFTDPAVGHVRTQDPAVLPTPLRGLVEKGLNFRPRIESSPKEALKAATDWARIVCVKLIPKRGAYTALLESTVNMFYYRLRKNTSRRQWELTRSGYDAELLMTQGRNAAGYLACVSTDKAANTASFECINWY